MLITLWQCLRKSPLLQPISVMVQIRELAEALNCLYMWHTVLSSASSEPSNREQVVA